MQHHRNDSCLQAGCTLDGQVYRFGRVRFYPVAETAQCAVGGKCCAYAGAKGVEGNVTARILYDHLELGPVLVVPGQW